MPDWLRRYTSWLLGAAAAVNMANVHSAASEGASWAAMGWAFLAGFWLLLLGFRMGSLERQGRDDD